MKILFCKIERQSEKLQKMLETSSLVFPFYCMLVALILSIPIILLSDVLPDRDLAYRYAPMADAFARGEFQYAFHPRVQLLHPLIAGFFAMIPCVDGLLGCKISSMLFFVLGVIPFYFLMRRVFSLKIANYAALLYLLCYDTLRLAFSGLRDVPKMFLLLFLTWILVVIWQEKEKKSAYFWMGLGVGLSCCIRGDMVLVGMLFLFVVVVLDCRNHPVSIPWRSMVTILCSFLVTLPELIVNYRLCGFMVPEMRFAHIFTTFFHHPATPWNVFILCGLAFPVLLIAGKLVAVVSNTKFFRPSLYAGAGIIIVMLCLCPVLIPGFQTKGMGCDFLKDAVNGMSPLYLVPALVAIGYRLIRREFSVEEEIILWVLLGHGVLIIGQIFVFDHYLYVDKRYMQSAIPLELGWSVIGIAWLWGRLTRFLSSSYRRPLAVFCMIVVALSLYFDAVAPSLKWYYSPNRRLEYAMFRIVLQRIQEDYQGPKYDYPKVRLDCYEGNMLPIVSCNTEQKMLAGVYQIGGRYSPDLAKAQYLIEVVGEGASFDSKGFVLMGTQDTGKAVIRLWKRI